jgi:hypothetical protein
MAKYHRQILGHEHCEYQDAPLRGREAIAGRTPREPDAVRIRRAWDSPDGPGVGLDPAIERLCLRPVFARCWRVSVMLQHRGTISTWETETASYFVQVQDEPPRIVFAGRNGQRFITEN